MEASRSGGAGGVARGAAARREAEAARGEREVTRPAGLTEFAEPDAVEALARPARGATDANAASGAGAALDASAVSVANAAPAAGWGAPPNKQRTARARSLSHQNVARRITPPRWLHSAVIIVALLPLAWIIYALASDFFQGTRLLGSNPIKEAEHGTGEMTIRLLFASLAVTPAIKLLKQGWLIRYRRTFGLLAFSYVCAHLLIYFTLDLELVWGDLVADLKKRVYIMFGMAGFLLLLPLAVTSTKGWIRRLGSARWNSLHRAVYAAVVTGIVHYWMAVKRDITAPLIFAVLFALLFGFRIWWNSRRSVSV
jgi:methionine sulfoxide reductase heme-binding subunit